MKQISKKDIPLWIGCISLTVLTGAVTSVWTVFLLQRLVEVILPGGMYAPHLLILYFLSVLAGALSGILQQKLRYVLYQKRVARLEDRIISACSESGENGKSAFVLIQNTVDSLVTGQTDWVLECCGIFGISLLSGIYTCSISVSALLICLAVTGTALCLMHTSSRKVPGAAKLSNEKMNAVYGEMWNYLRCKEILPFLQPGVYGKYEEKLAENKQGQILLGKYTNTARICMRFGSVGVTLIAIVYFGILTLEGRFTLPKLLAVTMLLPILAENMLRIPNCISQYKKFQGIERNISAFLECSGQETKREGKPLGERITSIRASGIEYSYQEGECCCRVEEFSMRNGHSVGIFGESGAGKTTLLKIILGELQADAGKCLVNGHDTGTLNRQELWSHILYLAQDSVILPVSLRENIVMSGNTSRIDEEKYLDSLRKAGLEELAAKTGNRELDEGALSSGEIQKICLARCFYTDREVLVLDEATNALSPDAERIILHHLVDETVQKNKILILVSHNPAAIALCDTSVRIQRNVTERRPGGENRNNRKISEEPAT